MSDPASARLPSRRFAVRFLSAAARQILAVAAFFLLAQPVSAQTDGLLQVNDPLQQFLERQSTLGNLPGAFVSHQPLSVYEARVYLDSLSQHRSNLSRLDRAALSRFLGEEPAPGATWVSGRVGKLYENGADFVEVSGDDFAVQINPLLYLTYGVAKQSARPDRDDTHPVWQNTRGIRLSGHIGGHFFFESRFEENQVRLPELAGERSGERRGFAYVDSENTFDYGIASGVIGWRSRFFEVRFGHDRQRWGPGRTSLMLSNYSVPHSFFQVRTTFGPFQYVNHFATLQDPVGERELGDLSRPFKYGAFHRLAVAVSDRVQLGLFESVILAPTRNERNPGFFFTFFNPVVLYHTLNLDIGSPGNAMLGLDGRWIVVNGLEVSAQLFIDDFSASKFFSDLGYWKNTYGFAVAARAIPTFVSGLDVEVQYSRARPYAYSNRLPSLGYTSRNGILGYPLGPNSEDIALLSRFQISERFRAELNASAGRRGRNTASVNYGSDPFRPYDEDRPGDTGISLLQGVRQDVLLMEGYVGYEVLPGLFIDGALRYEVLDDEELGLDRYVSPSLSLRWGLPYQSVRY